VFNLLKRRNIINKDVRRGGSPTTITL